MAHMGVIVGVVLLGCGCVGPRGAEPPALVAETPPAAAAPPPVVAAAPPVDAGAPAPVTLDAWARAQAVGAPPVAGADVPKVTRDRLLALAAPSRDQLDGERAGEEPSILWARALAPGRDGTGPALAFAYASPRRGSGPLAEFAEYHGFAVVAATPSGYALRAREELAEDVQDLDERHHRDFDLDGYPDTVVAHSYEVGGGGKWGSSGLVLIGSRAPAIARLEVGGIDAEFEGSPIHSTRTEPLVLCWHERVSTRPGLVLVTQTADSYQKNGGLAASVSISVLTTDASGAFVTPEVYAQRDFEGPLAKALANWQDRPDTAGAAWPDVPAEDDPFPADCGSIGALVLPVPGGPFRCAHGTCDYRGTFRVVSTLELSLEDLRTVRAVEKGIRITTPRRP